MTFTFSVIQILLNKTHVILVPLNVYLQISKTNVNSYFKTQCLHCYRYVYRNTM